MQNYQNRIVAAWALIAALLAIIPCHGQAQMPAVLAVGGTDRTIHLLDATGKPLQSFLAHDSPITCIAFSPDGKRVYSGSVDKTVKVWNADDGSLENSLDAHDKPVYCLALNPSGKVLVTGGGDNQVKLWNALTGKPLRSIPAHSQPVRAVAWSQDGMFFASGGADRLIQIWRADGSLVGTIVAHDDPINSLAWTRDSRFLFSASADGYVKIWSVADLGLVTRHRAHDRGIVAMPLTQDGRMVATVGADNRVRVWLVGQRALTELASITMDRPQTAVGWTRDSAWLIVGGPDRTLRFLKPQDLTEARKPVSVDSGIAAIALLP